MGVLCVVNYAVMQLVVGKANMVQGEVMQSVPQEKEGRRKLSRGD